MAPPRSFFFHLFFSCFLVAATTTRRSDAAGAPQLQAIGCSTAGNYTATDAYAANLYQLLAAVPSNTVSKDGGGGFFNGTVGQGAATVYGLAMCSADFSRSDCADCLTAASSNGTGLVKHCPGSLTASIMLDQCMLRYSNLNFFGTNETGIVFTSTLLGARSWVLNEDNLKQGLAYLSAQAALSPERFAASATYPYALVQCTWDLPPDKCKACIDALSANATSQFDVGIHGECKSYSCRLRYSNASFNVVPLVALAPTVNQSSVDDHRPAVAGPPRNSKKAIVAGAVAGTLVVLGSTTVVVLFCIARNSNHSMFSHKLLPKVVEETSTDQTAAQLGDDEDRNMRPDSSRTYLNDMHIQRQQVHAPAVLSAYVTPSASAATWSNNSGPVCPSSPAILETAAQQQQADQTSAQQGEEDRNMQPDSSPAMTNSNNSSPIGPGSLAMEPASQQQVDEGANATTGSNNRSPAGPSSLAREPLQRDQSQPDVVVEVSEMDSSGNTDNLHHAREEPKCMQMEELKELTKDFTDELGRGTFGTVYMGVQDGREIAVKMLHPMPQNGRDIEKDFKKEFENVWRLDHPNIVQLIGYCYQTNSVYVEHGGRRVFCDEIRGALCFEYMHNGSLQGHLQDESRGLDWQTRYKIIKGTCEGLKYLHKGLKNPVFHLDLKPGNILLDKNMVPKLADFGLSKLVCDNQTQATSNFLGTIGYCPPEHIERYCFSDKFDIFSLGVIMIEIITGPKGHGKAVDMGSQGFIDHVQENWRKRIHRARPGCTLPNCECQQVKRCIEIALECVHPERIQRPDIDDIISRLNGTENNTDESAPTSSSQNET